MITYFKQNKFLVIVTFAALVGLFSVISRDKSSTWDLTLTSDDQKPFGTFVFDSLMKYRFNDSYQNVDLTFYQIKEKSIESKTVIVIADKLSISPDDIHEIKRSISLGDRYIIASNNICEAFCDTFAIRQEPAFIKKPFWENSGDEPTYSKLDFVNEQKQIFDTISIEEGLVNSFFVDIPKESNVLIRHLSFPIAFRIPIGMGSIDLCSSPYFFTNYFLLNKRYSKVTNHILSNISTNEIIFASKYIKHKKEDGSIFKIIHQNRALNAIFNFTLILLLLFFIFGAKRKQRIIPIIEPLRNTSLDFIKLIGRMYFLKENHSDLCLKKFSYLKEYLFQKHFIRFTEENPDLLYQTIATKTGIEQKEVRELFTRINQIAKNNININKEELHRLIKAMERFY